MGRTFGGHLPYLHLSEGTPSLLHHGFVYRDVAQENFHCGCQNLWGIPLISHTLLIWTMLGMW